MRVAYPAEQLARFLQVLSTVGKKALVLAEVRGRHGRAAPITAEWISGLMDQPQQADLVESFAAKFGRMQDTMGDKLLLLFLRLVGEKTGTAIDNLYRGERLGLIPDAAHWLEMRTLRNLQVHEYMDPHALFARALNQAHALADDLFPAHRNMWRYCAGTLKVDAGLLPPIVQGA